MTLVIAKAALDKIVKKARVHLYKPIQIAEILHRDRVNQDIDLSNIDTYRNTSKAWRNTITDRFVGRSSSSSAEYQEALFTKAMPPEFLVILGEENRLKGGIIEAYIYRRFADRIVIVCRDSEQALIVSLLNQIGWKSKIQSIITETDLKGWYDRALRGSFAPDIGNRILLTLKEQIIAEFPATDNKDFTAFYADRNYNLLTDDLWI